MAAIPRAVCHIWGCTIIKDYIYIRRHRLFNIAKYWNNPACLKGQKDQKDWNNPSLKRSKPENSSSLHAHPQHNCWEAGGCPESHFEINRVLMLRTTNVDDDVFAIAGGFGSGIEERRVFISGISGRPKMLGITWNNGKYPIFQVTRYPMIFKIKLGRVSKKMSGSRRADGWIVVGHCCLKVNIRIIVLLVRDDGNASHRKDRSPFI